MAIYHLSIKSGSKGSGASGKAKSDYINREGKYANKPDLEYSNSGNMPEWAQENPRTFWNASDENERANGRVWTEIEIALPREFTEAERKKLVEGFIADQLKDHPYTVAIHCPKALDGGDQPHAHIIFSERTLDGIKRDKGQFFKRANTKEPAKGGAAKDRAWNDRDKVIHVRAAWERHINAALPFSAVSCKSLKTQEIDREPEPKLGPKRMHTPAVESVKAIRKCRRDLQTIDWLIQNVSQEIAAEVVQEKPIKVSNPSPVSPPKPVFVPPAQSEALLHETKANFPVQQRFEPLIKTTPVVAPDYPAMTTDEQSKFAAFVKRMQNIAFEKLALLCQIASDFGKLSVRNEKGILSNEIYNQMTDRQEKLVAGIVPTAKFDYNTYQIKIDGQPIPEIPKTQFVQPQQQKPAQTQGISQTTGGRRR